MHTVDDSPDEQAQRYHDIVQRLGELPDDSSEQESLKKEAAAIMQNLEDGLTPEQFKRLFERHDVRVDHRQSR